MSFTDGNVTELNFDDDRQQTVRAFDGKYGSFLVFVYTTQGGGATASFAVSKNENKSMIVQLSGVSGTHDEVIEMDADLNGSIHVSLTLESSNSTDDDKATLSTSTYYIKIIG